MDTRKKTQNAEHTASVALLTLDMKGLSVILIIVLVSITGRDVEGMKFVSMGVVE